MFGYFINNALMIAEYTEQAVYNRAKIIKENDTIKGMVDDMIDLTRDESIEVIVYAISNIPFLFDRM